MYFEKKRIFDKNMQQKYKIKIQGKEFDASEYQNKIFQTIESGVGNLIINAAAGSAKCLGRDTEILMYDGTIKKVQDIIVGDLLMGDDSNPRKVLSTTKNYGKLLKIIPKKGDSWICNDVHVLTLSKYRRGWKTRKSEFITVDIPADELIRDYQTPSRTHKDGDFRNFKLLKTGVKFKHFNVDFNPWLYGIWVGDGTTGQSMISNVDQEIIDEIYRVKPEGYRIQVVKYGNKCPTIKILSESGKKNTNKFRQFLRNESANDDGKYINKKYLINDENIRLKLLAGIIDSDGCYDRGYYHITTKYEQLCKDILFLARSLGFGAYAKENIFTCTNNGSKNYYYRISITGDIDKIPVVLSRKKANKRKINKNPLHVGFRIEDNGLGDYYGFTLDGNGRFLLSDYTVTHNTTTIVNAIRFIPDAKKILFIAFNKNIVNKIKTTITHEGATVLTFHSLGYYILLENKIIRNTTEATDIINEYKYKNYAKTNITTLTENYEQLGRNKSLYINNIVKLIEYARYYLAMSIKDIERVAELYDIVPLSDEFEVCRKVLLWGKENIETIDYTDLLWLPNVLNLTTKKYQFNWIFIDEAQDTSIVEQKLVDKCFKRGTRFAAVMDEHQQINIWCGSTLDAINNFLQYSHTNQYKLPISYRCPKKIVELAQEYSDNIIALDTAIDGEIRYNVSPNEPIAGDMVLCRTTAPLVEQFLKYLRINKKAYIRGFENIKKEYLEMISNTKTHLIDRNCVTFDGLFPKLYVYLFNEIDRVMSTFRLDEDDALCHQSILSIYDNIEALKVLSEGLITTQELIDKINIIFNGDITDAVELSTIHKAKGLEADNVYILQPSLMPSKFAKKEWEIKTERNLMYVAYTRAKKTLNFIKEDEHSYRTGGYFDMKAFKNNLDKLRKILNYNRELSITEDNFKDKPLTGAAKKLGENKTAKNLINNNKPNKSNTKSKLNFRDLL